MERLLALASQAGLLGPESAILSIAWDDPARTPPAACRYDACLVLQEGQTLPGADVRYGSLTGGRYAVFPVPHTEQAVSEAWHAIDRLLRETGCTADSGPSGDGALHPCRRAGRHLRILYSCNLRKKRRDRGAFSLMRSSWPAPSAQSAPWRRPHAGACPRRSGRLRHTPRP